MKKLVFFFLAIIAIIVSPSLHAQQKIGHIDISALIVAMPEYKRADTVLSRYQYSLNQQYASMVSEFNQKDSLLASRDTVKYTRAQLEIKRRDLGQLYVKLQGWNQQAQQLYNSKESELLSPIQRKANLTIETVAKENGYTYVLSRQALVITPPAADDLLPLVKKKLGIK